MTSIQPELWVDTPREAVTFYEAAFGAPLFTKSAMATTSSRNSLSERRRFGWQERRRR